MQHLGSEDEMVRTLQNIFASMPVKERLQCLSTEERLEGLSSEERLKGLPPEERLKGLTPEELERLKQLVQQQAKADDGPLPP